jgi:hypothetical protein
MQNEPMYKIGDLVKLREALIDKVVHHKTVFKLYHPWGGPREWIMQLCGRESMRVKDIKRDANNKWVIDISSDPCESDWQQEWFELVGHENFTTEEDLFSI